MCFLASMGDHLPPIFLPQHTAPQPRFDASVTRVTAGEKRIQEIGGSRRTLSFHQRKSSSAYFVR